jgi:hypothetical protein
MKHIKSSFKKFQIIFLIPNLRSNHKNLIAELICLAGGDKQSDKTSNVGGELWARPLQAALGKNCSFKKQDRFI